MEIGVQIFSNPQFGDIRVSLNQVNEPMFCLNDVCKALELSTPSKVKDRLNPKGVNSIHTLTNGGSQSMTYISESNLYKCIFQSRKAEAERFQDWVCEEILPSIRKNGGYIATKADETPEEIMAKAILLAQKTIEQKNERIAELEKVNKEQSDLVGHQKLVIESQKPKVAFCDAIVSSQSSCLIGELAKILTQNGYKIGQNRLFQWLREHDYLGKHGERYNIPNQQYMEMGLFEVKKTVHDQNGVLVTKSTPKVTGRGQEYFINKFLRNL